MVFEASSTTIAVGRLWLAGGAVSAPATPAPKRAAGKSKSPSLPRRFPRINSLRSRRAWVVIPRFGSGQCGRKSFVNTADLGYRAPFQPPHRPRRQPQFETPHAMTNPALDLLLSRRSVSANSLTEPGPNAEELQLMLRAATRVPDHKKLVPWRFLLFQGEARAAFGKALAEICREEQKDSGAFRLENEEKRFLRAPLVIAVISRVVKNPAAPDWEQILSVVAACQNLILAATALGYGANWITEWCGYSEGVRRLLRLAENERVAGFVYVGTAKEKPPERERPDLDDIVTAWTP